MSRTGVLSVGIIEDQFRIREGLKILIDGTDGYRCTGTYASMEEALEQIGRLIPDVLLVDVGLPRMSGIEGIRLLKERYPDLPMLVLTINEDDKRIFDAICAGACGYLLNMTPPARLLECVREAAEGGAPMSPEIARRVIAVFREIRPAEDAEHHLTPHEVRLLKLLVDGRNYKTAGAELGVNVNTIRFQHAEHLRQAARTFEFGSSRESLKRANCAVAFRSEIPRHLCGDGHPLIP